MNWILNSLKATELTEKWARWTSLLQRALDGYKKLMDQIKGEDERSSLRLALKSRLMEQLEAEHTAKMEAYSQKWNDLQGRLLKTLKVSPEALTGHESAQITSWGMAWPTMKWLNINQRSSQNQENKGCGANRQGCNWIQWSLQTPSGIQAFGTKNWWLKQKRSRRSKPLEAEGGWDSMQFIPQRSKSETNARLTISRSLTKNGQWEKLSPEEKELLLMANQPLRLF